MSEGKYSSSGPIQAIQTERAEADERLIKMFAEAIGRVTSAPISANIDNVDPTRKFLARQATKELPKFTGRAEDWPIFEEDFHRTTLEGGYSNSDNISRLRKSLGGDAVKYVHSLMVSPDNVPQIIQDLKERYGQPEHIIRAMIEKVRKLAPFKTDQLEALIEFGSAVRNLTATVKMLQKPEHLCNPQLQKELEDKLPPSLTMQWLRWISGSGSRRKDIDHFSQWISEEVSLACQVCPPTTNREEKVNQDRQREDSNVQQYKGRGHWVKEVQRDENIPTAAGLFVGDRSASKCVFCDKHSDSSTCSKAIDMSLEDKRRIINSKNCCEACLKPNHIAKNCRAYVRCVFCKKKHYTIMCPEIYKTEEKEVKAEEKVQEVTRVTNNLACSQNVILQTLQVNIIGKGGLKKARMFIDPGSQRSYILKHLAEELKLKVEGQERTIHTVFTGVQTQPVTHNKFSVRLLTTFEEEWKFVARDQVQICGDIPRVRGGLWLKELRDSNIWLNDIGSGCPEIGILLGADYSEQILTGRKQYLSNNLTAIETIFGWTVIGQYSNCKSQTNSMAVTNLLFTEASIEDLWNLETLGIRDPAESISKCQIEEQTKLHFLQTVTRNEDGRYSVSLPWIENRPELPSNRRVAEIRLDSTTRRLQNLGLYQEYDKIFKGWEQEGIIEVASEEDLNTPSHYLPHRGVLKPDSETTPVRPVFDASCKTNRTPSLNDCLERGPNLLEVIPSILHKFRIGNIGVLADIRKAFQMVDLRKEDQDYVRFLWWEDSQKKIYKIYRHRRVVFGVNCSPFLLAAVLEHLLTHVSEEDMDIASKVLKSLYVDNLVTSVNTLEEAEEVRKWSTEIMEEAKMDLRCWEGGFEEKSGIDPLTSSGCGLDFGRAPNNKRVTSVLGYRWDKIEDKLFCDFSEDKVPEKISKRIILSYAQRVFDPIGFTCPATLKLKIMLQDLWELKVKWDDELNKEQTQEFKKWFEELDFLRKIQINRNMTGWNPDRDSYQLHTFCDASKSAYAAVLFLRTKKGCDTFVQLSVAKSRVSPLKKITINRLELMGCLIGARLTATIKRDLSLQKVPTFLWTDSSTVLAWIRRSDKWGTFVGNRVTTINNLTQVKEWRHVPGVMNPADLPSRGCTPSQLFESRWWEGPEWLLHSEIYWPEERIIVDEVLVGKEKKVTVPKTFTVTVTDHPLWYLPRSDFAVNVKIVAWILRFVKKTRLKSRTRGGESFDMEVLSVNEIKQAEETMVKLVQRECFSKKESVICGLKVKVDKNNDLICVETKLMHREDTTGFRYPVLLPHQHPVVEQIIRRQHLSKNHAGAQMLLSSIRENYWIVKGRRAIRRIVDKCVKCRRFNTKRPNVEPASLPTDRVATSRVFEVIGVDLAGPLLLKSKEKVWIVIFTCSVYRCLDLELVDSLSTESFMEAFTRFVSRRGRPVTVHCDNGTNFVGSYNCLRELDWERVEKVYAIQKINWKFNPPAA